MTWQNFTLKCPHFSALSRELLHLDWEHQHTSSAAESLSKNQTKTPLCFWTSYKTKTNKMATHRFSKHTINLKQEEFSTTFLLKNIVKEIQLKQASTPKAFLILIFKKNFFKKKVQLSLTPSPTERKKKKKGSQTIF